MVVLQLFRLPLAPVARPLVEEHLQVPGRTEVPLLPRLPLVPLVGSKVRQEEHQDGDLQRLWRPFSLLLVVVGSSLGLLLACFCDPLTDQLDRLGADRLG